MEFGSGGGVECLANPVGPVKIAHSAGRILKIGFKLENRIAVPDVPLLLGFDQPAKKSVAVLANKSGQNAFLEFRRRTLVACQMTAIQKRRVRFNMGRVVLLKIRRLTNLVTHLEWQVPQRIENLFDNGLIDDILEEQQKIQIGFRMQGPRP